jgi:hypothetical protein
MSNLGNAETLGKQCLYPVVQPLPMTGSSQVHASICTGVLGKQCAGCEALQLSNPPVSTTGRKIQLRNLTDVLCCVTAAVQLPLCTLGLYQACQAGCLAGLVKAKWQLDSCGYGKRIGLMMVAGHSAQCCCSQLAAAAQH